jgi:hypothetical protein
MGNCTMESMARKRESHCNIVGTLEAIAGAVVVAIILTSVYLIAQQVWIWLVLKFAGGEG